MSQAGRIPAGGAHLSGQERERRRARPPEKAAAPAAPSPAPRRTAAGQGRSHFFSLQSSPGAAPSHPSKLQTLVPWDGVASYSPAGIAVLPSPDPGQWVYAMAGRTTYLLPVPAREMGPRTARSQVCHSLGPCSLPVNTHVYPERDPSKDWGPECSQESYLNLTM